MDSLADLLDRERAAILSGDFPALERLGTEKARLMADIGRDRVDMDRLARLQSRTNSNNTMLAAAAEGIRAALDSLKRAGEAAPAFFTYDQQGQKQNNTKSIATMERRA